mmetsp:Transcript_7994/g.19964  ORF Transcript_7994/g.19964 Transcript_7994/m.19964 type:complete len:481 (-) Transcript_7994:913-2355(-)
MPPNIEPSLRPCAAPILSKPSVPETLPPAAARVVSPAELASHNDPAVSPWIAIRGRVFDVTGFAEAHPGGGIVYTYAGRDATGVFSAFHTGKAYAMLKDFYVGELDKGAEVVKEYGDGMVSRLEADIAEMRATLVKEGRFKSSKAFYAYKVGTNVAILSAAVALALNTTSLGMTILAAAILGLFFQQCGWLAHDFLHHQVFQNRVWGNVMGLVVGNLWQGFSTSWWKLKHNHHHAVPNVVGDGKVVGDPDIDTHPVLLWSEHLLEGDVKELTGVPSFLVRNQKYFYFPILCMARVSWLIQSAQFQSSPAHEYVGGWALKAPEIITLAIHHLSFLLLVSRLPSFLHMALFTLVSQALGGLFIGLVFTVGHNAMHVLPAKDAGKVDFAELQIRTTRNISPTAFNCWFSGGLGYQIEHHIWPTLPRHSLPRAAELVQKFCEKHGLEYTCEGLIKGNMDVCRLLARLSDAAAAQDVAPAHVKAQ